MNLNMNGMEISPTVGLHQMQNELISKGKQIYKFGFGQSPFPVPNFMVESLRKNASKKAYLPIQGLPELREAVASKYRKDHDLNITADNVLISPGSKEALFLLQLSYYSDLLLPSPSWVSYHPQSTMVGHKTTYIPTSFQTHWKIDIERFEYDLQQNAELNSHSFMPRILILNSPSNPTGMTYNAIELEAIANICRKNRILVVSDEIYDALHYNNDNSKHESITKYYPEGTILLNGISKWPGAGGWRLGFLIFPNNLKWLLDVITICASETYTSASAPIQYAAVEAFSEFDCLEMQTYLKIANKVLNGIAIRSTCILREIDGCSVHQPQGGFYIFPDFTNVENIENMIDVGVDSKSLTMNLLKSSGVSGLSGVYFGRPLNELSMRLSYVDFDGERVMDNAGLIVDDDVGIESSVMDEFLEKYCANTMNGMRALRNFMNIQRLPFEIWTT